MHLLAAAAVIVTTPSSNITIDGNSIQVSSVDGGEVSAERILLTEDVTFSQDTNFQGMTIENPDGYTITVESYLEFGRVTFNDNLKIILSPPSSSNNVNIIGPHAVIQILLSTISDSVTIDTGLGNETQVFIVMYGLTLKTQDGIKITGSSNNTVMALCSICRPNPTPNPNLEYIQVVEPDGFLSDSILNAGENVCFYTGPLEDQTAPCLNELSTSENFAELFGGPEFEGNNACEFFEQIIGADAVLPECETSSTSCSSSSELSAGAIAGIAVGSMAGGTVIGAALYRTWNNKATYISQSLLEG